MAGFVYLIGNRTFRWYKIGKSIRPTIRVSELGILLPFRMEVIAVWKAENHDDLERLLHEQYAASRINGEWFSFDSQQVTRLLIKLLPARVSAAAAYSNLEQDSVQNAHQVAMVRQKPIVKLQRRISSLTSRVKQLEACLESHGIIPPTTITPEGSRQNSPNVGSRTPAGHPAKIINPVSETVDAEVLVN